MCSYRRENKAFRARIAHLAELHYGEHSSDSVRLVVPERWLPPACAFNPEPNKSAPWILLAMFIFASWLVTLDAASGLLLVMLIFIASLYVWTRL